MLQLLGDPRAWPRGLRLPRKRILWRKLIRADPAAWPPPNTQEGGTARLKALARAQYDETRLWFLVVTYLYVGGAVFAGLAFLVESHRTELTAAAVACQILAALTRIRAARLHSIAHEADWRALLLDALGPTRAELDRAAMLENLISDGARRRAGLLTDDYTSSAAPGTTRLVDHLRQTAYVTGALYGGAKVQAFFLAAFVILIPLTGPIYWLATGSTLPPEAGVLLVTAVLPLWDVMGRQGSWRNAETTLHRVVDSLDGTEEMRDALPLMVDAMTATAMAPPIPRTVYVRWFKEGLSDRWRTMMSYRDGPPPPQIPLA